MTKRDCCMRAEAVGGDCWDCLQRDEAEVVEVTYEGAEKKCRHDFRDGDVCSRCFQLKAAR